MSRIILLLLLTPMIGGCALFGGPGSVAKGECKIFEAPKYAIKGKTQYDQDWADSTIEGGVGGCHWDRPAPRPASLDTPIITKAVVPPVKAKRHWLFNRAKDSAKAAVSKVWPEKPVAPVEASPPPPEPPAPVVPQPEPVPPPPRSPIDRLLHPNE